MDNSIEQLTDGWFTPEGMEQFFALQDVQTLSKELNRKIGTVNKGAKKEYRLINHWSHYIVNYIASLKNLY